MLGIVEDRVDVGALDDLAQVHDDNILGHFGDDTEIVGDVEDGHVGFGLEFPHQVQDLGLGSDIESGGRFVGDQQLGAAGERHGDHGALTHAAAQLEGVVIEALLRVGHLHARKRLDGDVAGFGLVDILVQEDGLGDLFADGTDRAERGHRLLEDHRDLIAANIAKLAAVRFELGDVDDVGGVGAVVEGTVEANLAFDDLARGRDEAHDRHGGHALAAAALAYDTDYLPAADVEVDAIDGAHGAFLEGKVRFQIPDLQKGFPRSRSVLI